MAGRKKGDRSRIAGRRRAASWPSHSTAFSVAFITSEAVVLLRRVGGAAGGRHVDRGEAEMVAQGGARVVAAEQPAALQFRHDEIDEFVEGAGKMRRQDVE